MSLLYYVPKRTFSSKKFQPLYFILKVRPNSTPKQIRESFLKLSKIYHPDNPDTGNEKKFIRLKEAYDKVKHAPLLSDSYKTSFYQEGDDKPEDLSHKAFVRNCQLHGPSNSTHSNPNHVASLYNFSHYKPSWIDKLADRLIKTKR